MKTRNVVVFGASKFSSMSWFCLLHDSQWEVVAFTVDKKYLTHSTHEGLPVVPFEELQAIYPPDSVKLLIALGYTRINGVRMERFNEAAELGYDFINYISSRASIWPNQFFGKNCLVYENVIIQPFSRIEDNVLIRGGAHISHHCHIGSHSFVAAGVTLGGNVTVGERCFIGLGAVIRDGLHIAERTFIGAGAVVLSDTKPDGVYVGNPARRLERSSMDVTTG